MSRTLLSPARRRADRARLADEVVDVLVIGGGVTGAGAALDAASRGLSVALLEARDWAAGTSSRSSKLIHGGLRYLEQLAFPLVHEALHGARAAGADHRAAPGHAAAVPAAADRAGVAARLLRRRRRALRRPRRRVHRARGDPAAPAPVAHGHARGVPGPARRRRPRRDPLLGRPGRRRPAHARRRPHRRRLRRAGALQRPGRPGCSATATAAEVTGGRRAGGRPHRRLVVHRPRAQRHRRHRRVERRHRRHAAASRRRA